MTTFPPQNPLLPDRLAAEPPKWPSVIGIISIVWGSLGLICNGCGVVSHAMPNLLAGMGPAGHQSAANAGSPLMLVISVVGFLWSFVLLGAGITTLRRLPLGRALHLVWSAGAIPLGAIGTYYGYMTGKQQTAAQLQQMQNDPKTAEMAQSMAPYMDYMLIGMVGCGAVLGLAWPLFCLVWFGLVKRNSAEVAAGTAEVVA